MAIVAETRIPKRELKVRVGGHLRPPPAGGIPKRELKASMSTVGSSTSTSGIPKRELKGKWCFPLRWSVLRNPEKGVERPALAGETEAVALGIPKRELKGVR